MLWSFIAVCLSARLYVDASYRGPAPAALGFQTRYLTSPAVAGWQAPMFDAISYLVLAGLCASTGRGCADASAAAKMLYAIGAFFRRICSIPSTSPAK